MGYAAYRYLADPKRTSRPATLAFCWVHWRRQWFDIAKSPPAPTATEALKRIAELYEIEGEIRGKSADERRAVRQQKTKPLAKALRAWLEKTLAQVAGGSSIAQAIRYALNRWDGLVPSSMTAASKSTPTLSSAQSAEGMLCSPAATKARKNWAMLASLIESCKLH